MPKEIKLIKPSEVKGKTRIQRKKPPHFKEVMEEHLNPLYQAAHTARLTVMDGDEKPSDRNWRGMLVGAAALVRNEAGRYSVVTGYNTKRTSSPSCSTRKCAEERILEFLEHHPEHGNSYIVALMVVGDFQVDDDSGKHCTTLQPCGSCRRKLTLADHMRNSSIILTARPPNGDGHPEYIEVHTRKTLVHHHHIR